MKIRSNVQDKVVCTEIGTLKLPKKCFFKHRTLRAFLGHCWNIKRFEFITLFLSTGLIKIHSVVHHILRKVQALIRKSLFFYKKISVTSVRNDHDVMSNIESLFLKEILSKRTYLTFHFIIKSLQLYSLHLALLMEKLSANFVVHFKLLHCNITT